MLRRDLLRGGAALALLGGMPLSAAATAGADTPDNGNALDKPGFVPRPPLAPILARPDRIISLTVCTRPFRAQGPRIEAQRFGRKTLIHNYGHGGSGWSLSWGSAALAVDLARTAGVREIAVIGCGAIGLTTALMAQRAGFSVRIYAKDRPPDVRSTLATGVWSPNSRFCTAEQATPELKDRWERMARESFRRYQSLLGLPGDPIEWSEGYDLSNLPPDAPGANPEDGEPEYPHLERERLSDLRVRPVALSPQQHPFPVAYARRYTQMVFNISLYARLLIEDFQRAGGEIVTEEFSDPRALSKLREKTLINATGYGARALFGDESIIPVRGQLCRLIPQPEVRYGLYWGEQNLNVVARRDGIVVQAQAEGDFGNADTTPDRGASEAAVQRLAQLFPA